MARPLLAVDEDYTVTMKTWRGYETFALITPLQVLENETYWREASLRTAEVSFSIRELPKPDLSIPDNIVLGDN
jgi:hypothetical protein